MKASAGNPLSGQPIFSPEQVAQATGGVRVSGDGAQPLCGVSIDSRTTEPGNLFVAIRGLRFDGHDFVAEAFERGAGAALVDQWPLKIHAQGAIWRVPDTLTALGALAQYHRRRFKLKLVAVTGSSGKTTTKTMLAHLISGFEEGLATQGTRNNLVGVPLTLLGLDDKHKSAVLELGTNRWGEIRRLTTLTEPTIGLVTNIGPAHLETFKDLQGVLREKAGLWEVMSAQGTLILNGEDPLLRQAGRSVSHKVVWFGEGLESALQISRVSLRTWSTQCLVNGRHRLTIPIPGRHNLMNAWAALTCSQVLGFDLAQAVERLQTVSILGGRLFPREFQGALFIDDSYNANPDSFKAALEVIRRVKTPGRRMVVMGDMLELGNQAEGLHAQAGRWVAEGGIDFLIAVGRWSRVVLSAACEAHFPSQNGRAFDEVEEAGRFLMEIVRPGDAVLLKGSRQMQMEKVFACSTTSSTP